MSKNIVVSGQTTIKADSNDENVKKGMFLCLGKREQKLSAVLGVFLRS